MSGATNCPETPRQKMIGMMYLVLTAMLALNVSAAILNGYTQVDDSLHATIDTMQDSNAETYANFKALTKYGDQVAGIIVGPSDLTSAMGFPTFGGPKSEEYYDYIRKVIRVSKAHGKSSGIFMGGDRDIEMWHKEGMNIYWVSTELGMLFAEVRRVRKFIMNLE